MILQALNRYYERADLAPANWEYKEIPFFIVLDRDGTFIRLENKTSETSRRGKAILVPQNEIRSGKNAWQKPNLLWDHYGFVLGEQKRKLNGEIDPSDSIEKSQKQLGAFSARVNELASRFSGQPGLNAVKNFYLRNEHLKVIGDPVIGEVFKIAGANLTFILADMTEPIVHEPWVAEYLQNTSVDSDESSDQENSEDSIVGMCLVTGKQSEIARLHPKTKGICDKPAPLAAANTLISPAFSSYGKAQGYNFPISKEAAFSFTTALNHLLSHDSRQRLQIGDAFTTVFWAEEPHDLESQILDVFGEPPKDNPDSGTEAIKAILQSAQSGKFAQGSADTRFHVLGLAPNAARIAIRFWETATAQELAQRIAQHFADIKIARASYDPEHPSLFRLLTSLAVQRKAENIPPNLAGDTMRAILQGTPYPAPLLTLVVQRCRAEQEPTYARASLIKGALNRLIRRSNDYLKLSNATNNSATSTRLEKEFDIMLDPTNDNPAYLLGRLFATLEKIQEEASPGLNATIRDRYYSAASSTPVAVFTTLLRLKNHHLGKLSKGSAVNKERLISEILGGLSEFPRILSLPEQGKFALGYYHQRQAFFTKNHSTEISSNSTSITQEDTP